MALYHSSFRDFLLSDETFGVYADEAHQAIVRFLLEDGAVGWLPRERLYGVEQLLPHIFGGIVSRDRAARVWLAQTAAELLTDPEFLMATVTRAGPGALIEELLSGARALAPLSRVAGVEEAVLDSLPHFEAVLRERLSGATDPGSAVGDLLGLLSSIVSGVYADAYNRIRSTIPAGGDRTGLLTFLVNEVRQLADRGVFRGVDAGALMDGGDGERLVALAILKVQPDPAHFQAICAAVGESRSAFEQYHALDVVSRMLPLLSAEERSELLRVLDAERRDVRRLGVMDDRTRSTRIISLISRLLDEQPRTA